MRIPWTALLTAQWHELSSGRYVLVSDDRALLSVSPEFWFSASRADWRAVYRRLAVLPVLDGEQEK